MQVLPGSLQMPHASSFWMTVEQAELLLQLPAPVAAALPRPPCCALGLPLATVSKGASLA